MSSALHSKYENNYITCTTSKELWDALDAKFGVSDAGSELYIMEQLFVYKMVDNSSVVVGFINPGSLMDQLPNKGSVQ